MTRGVARLALLVLTAPIAVLAQPPRASLPLPTKPGTVAPLGSAPGEAAKRDTTQGPLVAWPEPDSVAKLLLSRPGYSTARFLADTIAVIGRDVMLRGKPAAVTQAEASVRAPVISLNDSLQILTALAPNRGDTVVLRDPAQNAGDVIVDSGSVIYDMAAKSARVTNVSTKFEEGPDIWNISARNAAFATDTVGGQRSLYAHFGELTTCTLPIPHYHFTVKDVKFVSGRLMVARSAVLYISDIPVMWLPFMVQDMRTDVRSGLLTPRLGVSEVVRNNPGYRRNIENVGYYFALNDYMDAKIALDWRSGAGRTVNDPGFVRYHLEWNYKVLTRFMDGSVAIDRLSQGDGASSLGLSVHHSQSFSQTRSLKMDINYSTNTSVARRNEFVSARAVATVRSSINYQQGLGPFQMSLGGSRTQYPGLSQVTQSFPTLSLTLKPIALASWLTWTPNLNVTNNENLHQSLAGPLGYRYQLLPGGGLDSTQVNRSDRTTTVNLDMPFKIGTFLWKTGLRLTDRSNNYPETFVIRDVRDSSLSTTRTFSRTYRTDLDIDPGLTIPALTSRFNVSPSVSIVNVDPGPFWVRNERTGGDFVHQSKRLQYGASVAPTLYGFFGGLGPFSRFRHTIAPTISYSYAPRGHISDDYLAALGRTRQGYLGTLAQSVVSVTLRTSIEGKFRPTGGDSAVAEGRKIRLLSLDFQPLSWDFERARATKRTGLSSDRFGFTMRSELLPTFDFGVGYSLFQGSLLSDTARFKPFRQDLRASLTLDPTHNPLDLIGRIFGRKPGPGPTPDPTGAARARTDSITSERTRIYQQAAGSSVRGPQILAPRTDTWFWRLNYTSTRQRPPVGGTIVDVDDRAFCARLSPDPVVQERCVAERQAAQVGDPNAERTALGGVFRRVPPTASVTSQLSTPLTELWFAEWSTTYDIQLQRFASHAITLRRTMHDWDALFSINKVPNGNFAFNFTVALRAEPDLKFDYNQATLPRSPR